MAVQKSCDEGYINACEDGEGERKRPTTDRVFPEVVADSETCKSHVDDEERCCENQGHEEVIASNGPGK